MTMSTPATPPNAPDCILLATDLGSRCDRALDRALALARQWRARLVVLTVVEPTSTTDRALQVQAERRLRADLHGQGDDLAWSARVVRGPVAETILQVTDSEGAGLIVTGVARDGVLGRIVLGSAVDTLARREPVPLLVVRNRWRAPYDRLLIASDFSPHSRHAFETAMRLFPQAAPALFHAHGNAYPMLAGMDAAQSRAAAHVQARDEARVFLDGVAMPGRERGLVPLVLEYGDAGPLLHERGLEELGELLVLGTRGSGGLAHLLLGSAAGRILEMATHDVLLVRPAGTL